MDIQGAQTDLRLYQGEDWQATGHAVQMPLSRDWYCDDHGVLQATIKLRLIGWLDQKGRVYTKTPPQDGFDGGSLTPLLVNPGCD
jgi:hypothetical protein